MKLSYEELEKMLEESQREFRSADITMQNLEAQLKQSKIDADCYKKGMEASNARLVQLAAENAGLKDKAAELVHEASEVYSAYNATITEPDGDFMDMQTLHEMQCVETPSTDAFLAEVRAQAHKEGAHFVANRMLAAWDAGFIDDTAKNAADIARMILATTEFMADAPEGDFDRSFADGVLEDIAALLQPLHAIKASPELDSLAKNAESLHGNKKQITSSMAKDIAFKLGAELNDEEADIFADGYNAAMLQGSQPVSNRDELPDDFISMLTGRAKYLREKGEIKSPELLERAAAALQGGK